MIAEAPETLVLQQSWEQEVQNLGQTCPGLGLWLSTEAANMQIDFSCEMELDGLDLSMGISQMWRVSRQLYTCRDESVLLLSRFQKI